jgi:FixJ family two-component response regulator
MGISGWLEKPLDEQRLLDSVERAIQARRRARQSASQ